MTLRQYPDIDRGWAWPVLVTSYSSVVIYSTTMFMNGVFYIALLETFGEGKLKTSLVGSLSIGLHSLFAPIASICINKFGCRVTMILGGAIVTTANVISAFANSLDALIVSAGMMTGIGYALFNAGRVVSLGYYFQKWRSQVLALGFVMNGAGMFVSAPLGLYTLREYGLSGAYLIAGCLNAQLCVTGMVCRPSSIERRFRSDRKAVSSGELSPLFQLRLLRNRAFLFFMLSTTCWNFVLQIGTMHLPNYMSIKGSSDSEITVLMTLFSVSNTIGRLLAAMTVGKGGIDSLLIHVGVLGVCGLVTTLFPLYSGFAAGRYLFAIQLGLYVGCPNALMTLISIQMLGISALSEANGFSYLFCGLGDVTGPAVAGFISGASGSYEVSFLIAGLVLLCGSALGMASSVTWEQVGAGGKVAQEEVMTIEIPPTDTEERSCVASPRELLSESNPMLNGHARE